MPSNPTPAEGVVVVPFALTEAMKEAYFETVKRLGFNGCINASTAWEAMLAARPSAPTQSAAQTGEVERLRAALEQIANPPYGLGFNKLRGIARKALSQPEPKA